MTITNAPEGFSEKVSIYVEQLIESGDDDTRRMEVFKNIGAEVEHVDKMLHFTILSWYLKVSRDQHLFDDYINFWDSSGSMTLILDQCVDYETLISIGYKVDMFKIIPLDEVFKWFKSKNVTYKDVKFMLKMVDFAFIRSFWFESYEEDEHFYEATLEFLDMLITGFDLVDDNGNLQWCNFKLHVFLLFEHIFQFSDEKKLRFTQEFRQKFATANETVEQIARKYTNSSSFDRIRCEKDHSLDAYKRIDVLCENYIAISAIPQVIRTRSNNGYEYYRIFYTFYNKVKGMRKIRRVHVESTS